jgi:hypothetical protein
MRYADAGCRALAGETLLAGKFGGGLFINI